MLPALIVLGSVAGFIGSKLAKRRGARVVLDMVLGAAGAMPGGFLFGIIDAPGVAGVNVYSLVVALIGSVAVLWAWHVFELLIRGMNPKETYGNRIIHESSHSTQSEPAHGGDRSSAPGSAGVRHSLGKYSHR